MSRLKLAIIDLACYAVALAAAVAIGALVAVVWAVERRKQWRAGDRVW